MEQLLIAPPQMNSSDHHKNEMKFITVKKDGTIAKWHHLSWFLSIIFNQKKAPNKWGFSLVGPSISGAILLAFVLLNLTKDIPGNFFWYNGKQL